MTPPCKPKSDSPMELHDILNEIESRAEKAREQVPFEEFCINVAKTAADVPKLVKAVRFLWEELSEVHAHHPTLIQVGANHVASILKG